MNIDCASYLTSIFNIQERAELIKRAVAVIRKQKLDFTSIAVRGVSGIVFGTLLAHRLKKNLIIVRKGESTHSSKEVEGLMKGENKILLCDDNISSGETISAIKRKIKHYCEENSWLKARVSYLPYGILYSNGYDIISSEINFINIGVD